MKSQVVRGRRVPFPEFRRERIYMLEFRRVSGLPERFAHWQPTVDAMLDGVGADGPIYLTADQALLHAGQVHRRPGPHVDGRWLGDRHEHSTAPPRERLQAQGLILAADQPGLCAWLGEVEGAPAEGGDCSHLDLQRLRQVDLQPGVAWMGDSCEFVHASVPVPAECFRSVVRLNVAGWLPHGID